MSFELLKYLIDALTIFRFISIRQINDESRIDSLKNLLLYQHHRFSFSLFDALLLKLFTRVHLSRRSDLKRDIKFNSTILGSKVFISYLTSTHFPESSLAQYSIHAKGFVSYWLSLEPFPLEIPFEKIEKDTFSFDDDPRCYANGKRTQRGVPILHNR